MWPQKGSKEQQQDSLSDKGHRGSEGEGNSRDKQDNQLHQVTPKETSVMKRKTLRAIICTIAVALGIGALICNPGHLFTASIVFVFGLIQCEKGEENEEVRL